jgi:glycosyltransferase involved in cell wall biosynthesis
LRILYVSPFYYPSIGGVERFCYEIAVRTKNTGQEVHILTQSVSGCNDNQITEGMTIHRIKPLMRFSKGLLMPTVRSKIRDISPDIIHIQGPAPGTADFIGRIPGTKMIMTCHNDLSLNDSLLYKSAVRAYKTLVFPSLVNKLDKIVMLSDAFRFFPKLLASVPKEKVCIIPNGVDVKRYSSNGHTKDEYKSELNIETEFIGLFVGSMEKLHAYKGIEYLLAASRLLQDMQITFALIGEGELRHKYESLARTFGINSKIKFLGKLKDNDLINYYRAADFFLLPSTSVEFMPLVLLEAFACGTPAIVSSIHGPMEMVKDGYNGYVALSRNPADIASKIRKIVSDTSLLKKMQFNSRIEALEKYSWDKVLAMYLALYGVRN